jgi:hypothetical protein
MMHMRLWAAEGMFGSIVALTLTYFILEPDTSSSGYADVLGWSTVVVFLILMIQGFWSRRRHVDLSAEDKRMHAFSYHSALFEWDGVHTAVSIVVTFFLIVHGFLLIQGLFEPSLALWLGALAFLILLLLNLSGLMTESVRKSRRFGLLKRLHAWLMLLVLVLVVVHVEAEATMFSLRLILPGMIVGLAAVLFVWIIIPMTVQFAQHT